MTRRRPAVVIGGLILLVAASTVARSAASVSLDVPWITPDETTYALLGHSLWLDGGFSVLGQPAPAYSLLYPPLAGLALLFGDIEAGVRLVQVFQALLVSLSAVVVFWWGRRFLTDRYALVAAALTLLPAALAYSGFLMTEALAIPVGVLALALMARALEEPTLWRQGIALAGLAAAAGVRVQLVVLLPVLVTAIGLAAVLARSREPIRRFAPTLAGLLAICLGGIAWLVARGSWGDLVGVYAGVSESRYSPIDVVQELAWHAGDLFLVVLGVPLLATVLVVVDGLRRGEQDPATRAFLALAAAAPAWLLLQVAAFASRFTVQVGERYLVVCLPLFFIGLALWLHRGAPRPLLPTLLAVAGTAALALTLPLDRVDGPNGWQDSFAGLILLRLGTAAGWAWTLAVLAACAAFVLVPRRWAATLALLVAVGLTATSVAASRELDRITAEAHTRSFAETAPDWVDRAVPDGAALFHTGERDWPSDWLHVFWNRSLDEVLTMPDMPIPGPLPQTVVVPDFDGRLVTTDGRAVDLPGLVAPASVTVAGERVGELRQFVYQPGLVAWRADPPLRLLSWATGFDPAGDFGATARLVVYSCGPGRLELTLLGKTEGFLKIRLNRRVLATPFLKAHTVWRGTVPGPPPGSRQQLCLFELEPPGLTGSTRIEYVRTS